MRILIFILVNCLTLTSLSSQNILSGNIIEAHAYDESLKSTLKKYEVFEMDVKKSIIDFKNTQELSFSTGSKSFNLNLYPNNLMVSFKESGIPHLLTGHSSNGENVNLTINDDFVYGFIRLGNSRLFIEPVRYFDKSAPRNHYVSYYDHDVIHTDEHKCGVETTDNKTEELNLERSITDECVIVDYALANAYDMVQEFGTVADVEDFNLAVLNTVQANFRSEFDTNIEYNVVDIFTPATSSADPFPSTENSITLLNSLTSWAAGGGNSGGSNGGFGVNYHMAGLWVDRDIYSINSMTGVFEYGTVGVAWTPGWHHVFENFTGNALQLQVMTSHEIGHNWDADHVFTPGFMMYPSVNPTTSWSSTSTNVINAQIGAQNYLDPCSDLGPPVANFFQSSVIACVGGQVEFEDQSQFGETRTWEFENGTPATSTSEKPTVTFNSTGQHYVKLTSTNGAGTDEYTYYIDVQADPGNPCFPSGSGGSGGITSVSLESIASNSGDAASAGRYEDFACDLITNLEPSTSYDVFITFSGSSSTSLRMYIDYNGDGDFLDAGEAEGNFTIPGPGTYFIPLNTNAGPVQDQVLRFRIINDIGTISNACENPTYGQVEDYGVVFSSGAAVVLGCTDPNASNYDPLATIDDGSCQAATVWYRDVDLDGYGNINVTATGASAPSGYVGNSDDCDDTDGNVYPNAPELCDGKLNDCNGSGIPLNEVDNDGDGYVECAYSAIIWDGPSVDGGGDCDDTDSNVYPTAPELCDGKLNDCNGSGIPLNEIDNDGDGYVECAYSAIIWDGPSVDGGGDCNDANNTVYPTASELCDGILNDCNGSGIPINEIDNDGDGYVECAYSSTNWVGSSSVIGGEDCDDTTALKSPGLPEICDGLDNNCDGMIDEVCMPCDDTNIVISAVSQNTYRAKLDLSSTAIIDESETIRFYAGGDIDFDINFEVTAGTDFLAEVLDCINSSANSAIAVNSGGSVFYSEEEIVKIKLFELVRRLDDELEYSDIQRIKITDLSQQIVFDGSIEELESKSSLELNEWFKTNAIYLVRLIDGDAQAMGKFIKLK